ncbi:hypothetical protein [Novosphingobium sp. 9U]|uniref:hypothetical protein n=1 Tax=Novosphingobium sp. 9U TaxID=2653158 RepID=UPI0012F2EDB9|nr:hypothetical protein [Novosphingobium sp. 9U]VWX51789.1 hypothetical protein NOVOSPHI9U_40393 [Novosphingobium sp. 9U]
MSHPPAFLLLLDYLEAFELPLRHRLREGEIVGGKTQSAVAIHSTIYCNATQPLITGSTSAHIRMEASIIGCQPVCGNVAAVSKIRGADQPLALSRPRSRPKARARKRKKELPGTRPARSAEAIASSAAKLREQRAARVSAVLPLVSQARAEGCVLLRDICLYLDRIGHKPPQGERWSLGTLSTMLPRDQEKRDRDDTSARLIGQAKLDGSTTNREIAGWLNERGHRTAYDKEWTAGNISRFIRDRARGDCER